MEDAVLINHLFNTKCIRLFHFTVYVLYKHSIALVVRPTHQSDGGRDNSPAKLEPPSQLPAGHLLDVLVPVVDPVDPGYSDALEEAEGEQHHAAGHVIVKDLKHVDATLEGTRRSRQTFFAKILFL